MQVSVVIPLFNEDESLPELCSWITRVMDQEQLSYEVILIDDGSTDNSWEIIQQLGATNTNIKGIRMRKITEKAEPLTLVLKPLKARLSLPWMPTYKIHLMKSLSSTAW